MENGARIDVSADLDGVKFEGAQGLGKFLRDDPRVPACLVRNVYAYGVGRKTDDARRGLSLRPGQGVRQQRISSARSDGADRFQSRVLQGRGSKRSPARVLNPGGRAGASFKNPEETFNELIFQSPLVLAWHAKWHGCLRGSCQSLTGSSMAMAQHSPTEQSCRSGSALISGGSA